MEFRSLSSRPMPRVFSVFLLIQKCSQLESNGIVMIYSDIMIRTSSAYHSWNTSSPLQAKRSQHDFFCLFYVCVLFVCLLWLVVPP